MDPYTRPSFESMALITIDTQVEFLDGQPFEIPGTTAVLPNMARLLGAFREKQRPIVHIVRLYKPDGSNVDLCRRAMVEGGRDLIRPGSAGSQLAPELLPASGIELDHERLLADDIQSIGPSEVVIYKSRWGAFYQTPLEAHLRAQEVDTLVFTGCNFPNCPRTSIYEASERDFRIILVQDALSGLYGKGEQEMRGIGVNLMTTRELVTRI